MSPTHSVEHQTALTIHQGFLGRPKVAPGHLVSASRADVLALQLAGWLFPERGIPLHERSKVLGRPFRAPALWAVPCVCAWLRLQQGLRPKPVGPVGRTGSPSLP